VAAAGLARALRRPMVAWIVLTITLWAWHTPSLYTVALQHSAAHALEHASLLLASALAWSVALSRGRASALGALGCALLLVASAVQGGLLGAVLLFAGTALYPVHGHGPALWGLTPLEDQQLAGALMWIPPSVVYLGAAAGVFIGSFRAMDRATDVAPRDGRTQTGVVA
jgi:putative membrane protein